MTGLVAAAPAEAAASDTVAVRSLSSTSGPLAGGERISLHGSGFSRITSVVFGGATAHSVRVTSAHVLSVVVPKHKAGRVDIRVITPVTESKAVRADQFTYVAPPTVRSVTVATGPTGGGTRITVKGKNFLHVKAILFGKAKGTKVRVVSSTQLLINVPAHTPGTVDVHVRTAYGTSKTVRADHFTYVAPAGPIAPIPPAAPSPFPSPGPIAVPVPPGPLLISTASLPDYGVATTYTGALAASGGSAPYHWSVRGLPNGLAVSDAGVLSGYSYAVAGRRAVTVTVMDSAQRTSSKRMLLTVKGYAGQLLSWGQNNLGQRGQGNVDTTVIGPKAVAGLDSVVAVVGTSNNAFAALADGSVMGWGSNQHGQVQITSVKTGFASPVQIPGLAGVTALTSGIATAYALTSQGTVLAWGVGYHGRLGDGSTTPNSGPVQVSGLTDAVSIAAAMDEVAAVRADGSVVNWGPAQADDLPDVLVPAQVLGLNDIVSVASNGGEFYALHADGTVSRWTLGFAVSDVPGLTHVVQLAGGQGDMFALLDDGTVRGWGQFNSGGELGDGTTLARDDIRTVVGVTGAQAITAIAQSAFVELSDGSVMTWGNNGYGDLGNGNEMYVATPVVATWLGGSKFVGGTVATGGGHESYVGLAIRRVISVIVHPPPLQ